MGSLEDKEATNATTGKAAEALLEFIERCPSMFHTTATIADMLDDAGFACLAESDTWKLQPGGRYYITRNASTLIAFQVGSDIAPDNCHFQICASHGDSPTFKVKAQADITGPAPYARLATETYGGTIDYTWLDRPLGVAGRVMVRNGARIESRLFASDDAITMIPSVAIHMNRSVNEAFSPKKNVDLVPLFSASEGAASFDAYLAATLVVDASDILARDLFLVNRQAPLVWGVSREFLSAPKLDDLACAYTSLSAFLQANNPSSVNVFCCFDNEEVGSNTKQGAMSTVLADALQRVSAALGISAEGHLQALSRSMLVSCDNAHALHPNHPEFSDAENAPVLGKGLVVKEAANQKYCTDAFSRAAFIAVCDQAKVPLQTFANRSDMQGGSTLGNLSNIQVSMHGVDVGIPQLAMHSSFETCAVADIQNAINALLAFYNAKLAITGSESITLA